jgi:hypothetical protein
MAVEIFRAMEATKDNAELWSVPQYCGSLIMNVRNTLPVGTLKGRLWIPIQAFSTKSSVHRMLHTH